MSNIVLAIWFSNFLLYVRSRRGFQIAITWMHFLSGAKILIRFANTDLPGQTTYIRLVVFVAIYYVLSFLIVAYLFQSRLGLEGNYVQLILITLDLIFASYLFVIPEAKDTDLFLFYSSDICRALSAIFLAFLVSVFIVCHFGGVDYIVTLDVKES